MENVDVRSQIDELASLRRQARIWRTSLTVLALVYVLVCVLMLYSAVTSLANEGPTQKEFVSQLGSTMQEKILPQVRDVAVEAIHSVNINAEIKKLNARAPEVADAGMKELRSLSTDIPKDGQKIIQQRFKDALDKQQDKLKQDFPGVTAEQLQTLTGALAKETQNQVVSLTDELFSPYIDSTNKIIANVDKIKAEEGAAAKSDVPTWEMAFMIIDIARSDLDIDSQPAAAQAPTPAVKHHGKKSSGKEKKGHE